MHRSTLLAFTALFFSLNNATAQVRPPTGWYYAAEKTDTSLFAIGPKDTAFIYPTAVITVKDFKKLKVAHNKYGNLLEVTLTPAGREKFAIATKNWVGRKLAFVFDGILEMAPIVQTEITGGKLSITGNFTSAELNALKKKLEKEMKVR
jgi:preprotein translocase subunit SecD